MQALTFTLKWPRLAAAKLLGRFSKRGYTTALGPLRLQRVPDPDLLGDDWVIVATRRAGICGSDVKQVHLAGAIDNPLTALISFPHVLGHEMVGEVAEIGPTVDDLEPGDRVVVYPWLTCATRGLSLCAACQAGQLTTCRNLTGGAIAPGMHSGNCRDVSGAFAPLVPAHRSMCFPVPDGVADDVAVQADPFAVCLRALQKAPPQPGQTVLVLGCGALGMMLIHLLERLHPAVNVWAVDRLERLRESAIALGAARFSAASGEALLETVADWVGAPLQRPWRGLPWLFEGADVVYDMVGSAGSFEVGVRVARTQGTIVVVGVGKPARFEWTPLYFKELTLRGSNGAALEGVADPPVHAFEHYLELVAEGRLDPSQLVTHHFVLADYRDAFDAAGDKRRSGAIKVVFDF